MKIMKRIVCLFRGHVSITQTKIHKNRIAGMHRGICKRCGDILWITYEGDK